jgi:uncharacterized membrane protein
MSLPKPSQHGDSDEVNPPILNLGKTTVFNTPIDSNLASAIAYLPLGPLAIAAAFVLLNSPSDSPAFNRYHAMQSLVFAGAMVALLVLTNILTVFLSAVPIIGLLLGMPVALFGIVVGFAYFGMSLKLAYETFSGRTYRLPYLAKYVDEFSSKI